MTRRTVLTGLGAAAGAAALAACGGGGEALPTGGTATAGPAPDAGGGTTTGGTTTGGATASVSPGGPMPTHEVSAGTLADLPVGTTRALSIDGRDIIISRPDEEYLVAFANRCTHMQCVMAVRGDTIVCPCHQSQFDPVTGDVLQGPATKPLTPLGLRIDDDTIVVE